MADENQTKNDENPIENRVTAILEDELARIVRKDMTVMSELLAKYRYYRSTVTEQEDLSAQILDVEVVLMNVRDALDDILTVLPNARG